MVRFITRRPLLTFAILTVAACVVIGPRAVGHFYGHTAATAVGYVASFIRGVWGGI